MTQWEHYLEDIVAWKGSKDLLSAMREILGQIDSYDSKGSKFLFDVYRELVSECGFDFGEAVRDTFIEDLPPGKTAQYLVEIFCLPQEPTMAGKLMDPTEFLFEPIFGVDFPGIYGSLLNNIIRKIEKKDPEIFSKIAGKIRKGVLAPVH